MNTEEILKAISKKFSGLNPTLLICEDGSGRVVSNPFEPYEDDSLMEFGSIAHLISQLRESS